MCWQIEQVIFRLLTSNLLCLQPKSLMKKPEVRRLVQKIIALVQVRENEKPGYVGATWNGAPIMC